MTRKKRDPLPAGDPRRMTDARCAWRKMDEEQRAKFLLWLKVEIDEAGTHYPHMIFKAQWGAPIYDPHQNTHTEGTP